MESLRVGAEPFVPKRQVRQDARCGRAQVYWPGLSPKAWSQYGLLRPRLRLLTEPVSGPW